LFFLFKGKINKLGSIIYETIEKTTPLPGFSKLYKDLNSKTKFAPNSGLKFMAVSGLNSGRIQA
jgi:hypothetical protein